jgi:hypothetical protein
MAVLYLNTILLYRFEIHIFLGRLGPRIATVQRYVLRGGRWGYDRVQMLARARRAA